MSVHFQFLLAYDGTEFAGWQIQPGQRSVQGELTKILNDLTGESVKLVASGRTDAGVHASGQIASARLEHWTAGPHALQRAMNGYVPTDISVLDCRVVPDSFHPILDCVAKRYEYRLRMGGTPDPFMRYREWFVHSQLDIAAMQQGAALLRGLHDFACFQSSGSRRLTTTRNIHVLELLQQPANYGAMTITFGVEADGFLYNMVRNIVGTLVHIGRRNQPASWVNDVLAGRNRRRAGPTAPAQGLCLTRVDYLEQKCEESRDHVQ